MPENTIFEPEYFRQSLEREKPPSEYSGYLQSLWFDGAGDWDTAHKIIQDMPGPDAARIHAYLHRKEGDLANAGYWYSRSGRELPDIPLSQEWESLVDRFCREPEGR